MSAFATTNLSIFFLSSLIQTTSSENGSALFLCVWGRGSSRFVRKLESIFQIASITCSSFKRVLSFFSARFMSCRSSLTASRGLEFRVHFFTSGELERLFRVLFNESVRMFLRLRFCRNTKDVFCVGRSQEHPGSFRFFNLHAVDELHLSLCLGKLLDNLLCNVSLNFESCSCLKVSGDVGEDIA